MKIINVKMIKADEVIIIKHIAVSRKPYVWTKYH